MQVTDASHSSNAQAPFWRTKTLSQMSESEWESLCDGCGKCCCFRMEDADDLPGKTHGRVYVTDVACKLLDRATARCSDYAGRKAHVPDCVRLTPDAVGSLYWLPQTCAYRLVNEGRDLFDWHPLVSGRAESVVEAGMSVAGRTVAEEDVEEADHPHRIVIWPGEDEIS